MAVKLIMTWNIAPEREQEYFEFVVREFIPGVKRLGFEITRRSPGSHIQLAHPDGRRTTVPDHGDDDIGIGLLRKILRDVEVSPYEFSKYL